MSLANRVFSYLTHARLPRPAVDALMLPIDYFVIRREFRKVVGRSPRIFMPVDFNDWMQRLKLLDRKPIYQKIADKVASREYAKERIGEHFIVPPLWVGKKVAEVDFSSLPQKFVIKSTHGSGHLIIVDQGSVIDLDAIHQRCDDWLRYNHSLFFGEWVYRWIEPRIVIEDFMSEIASGNAAEYQFWCINGICRLVEVDFGVKQSNWTRLFFDREHEPLSLKIRVPQYSKPFTKSPNYQEMLRAAEALAAGIPFLRVDFFDLPQPRLGELTFFPGSGTVKFQPPEYAKTLGDCFYMS